MKKRVLTAVLLASFSVNCAFADFREHFDLGQSYLSQYQYSGAITEFKSALRINYLDTSARIGLINALIARGSEYANKDGNYAKAADDYRSALFYLVYYPSESAVRNSSQAISQVSGNLDICLNAIKFDRSAQNRYAYAKKLRAEGNFPAAAYEFTQALGDRSQQKDSFEQIGDILNLLGNKPRAQEYYKKAVAVSPTDLNLRLSYAKILDENKNEDDAIKEYAYVLSKAKQDDKEILFILERTFAKKLEANPTNANLNVNMGAVFQKEGLYDKALTYYKQAEALDPSNINTRINVGTLYQQKGDYRTAIKAYESVLILYPDNINALLYRAQCYDKLGDSRIAQEGYKKVLSLDPNNEAIREQMLSNVKKTSSPLQFVEYVKTNFAMSNPSGIIYDYAIELHKEGKIDDALYMYDEAIKLADTKANSEMYVNKALAQAQNKDYDGAMATLNSANIKFPNDKTIAQNINNIKGMKTDSLLAKASELYNKKDYDGAIKTYLSINPPNVNTMLGIATSYQEKGDVDEAIKYYKKALELKPVDSDIAYYIAVLYGEKDDYVNAKDYLRKAITFNKNNRQAVEYLASIEETEHSNLLNDAITKYDAGDYDNSLSEFNQVLAKEPNNAYALYYRGMIYDSQAKRNEAITDLKKAYELNKDFTICNYMIATEYDALEKFKEAYEYYNIYANSNAEDDDYKKYAAARAEELKDYAKTGTPTAKK